MLASLRIFFVMTSTLFLSWTTLLSAEQPEHFLIKSRVNNEVITSFDLDQRIAINTLLMVESKKLNSEILKQLIDERLQFQFANSRGIFLSNEEIENKVKEFLLKRSLKNKILLDALKRNGIEWSSFQTYIISKTLWKKTLLYLYSNKAKISDYQLNLPPPTDKLVIKRYLDLSEIVIPFSERGRERSILLAKRLQVELNAGGDFSNAAKRFSRSQSNSTGGALGFIEEKVLPKNIKNLLTNMTISQVSSPIILNSNIALFKLNAELNKEIKPTLDYLITFIRAKKVAKVDFVAIKACNKKLHYQSVSALLSSLDSEEAQALRSSEPFEITHISNNRLVVLCKREIKGDNDYINEKKAVYFNKKMVMFSRKLMLKLYREAIIN